MAADELRRQADEFIELASLENVIGRAREERSHAAEADQDDVDEFDEAYEDS